MMKIEYKPRIDPDEIMLLHEGAITSAEALDLTEAEHDALAQELQPLFATSVRLFREAPERILEQRNNGKQPPKGGSDKVTCDDDGYRRCLWYASVGIAMTPFNFWPALGLASIHYCMCEYCKGGKVETICLR